MGLRSSAVILMLVLTLLSGCTAPPPEAPAHVDPPGARTPEVEILWAPETPETGRTVSFGIKGSLSKGDEVEQVVWDLAGVRKEGQSVEHVFEEAGEHPVRVELTAREGGTGTAETVVQVIAKEGGPQPTSSPTDRPTPEPMASEDEETEDEGPQGFVPHVVVAVPDSGINPYHELYHRPELTEHPCTYIQDFPCSVKELPLSVGESNWNKAFEKDQDLWDSLRPGQWYWIPQTVFVAVSSENCDGVCILDDTDMHGTGSTSSVVTENPDVLLAFKEGGPNVAPFLNARLPVDIFSVSWGYTYPVPVLPGDISPAIYVKSAGNDPRSTLVDGWAGDPRVISVGGAYAHSNSEEAMASKQPEIVSYYCRPTADTNTVTGIRSRYCGTSFGAPTAAGGLSKVILGLRQESGYLGSVRDGMVDPELGISTGDLRDAMNRTASYAPKAQYTQGGTQVPLVAAAPYVQWGWGFYDGLVADATLEHLLGGDVPDKSADTYAYMEAQYLAKQATHPL